VANYFEKVAFMAFCSVFSRKLGYKLPEEWEERLPRSARGPVRSIRVLTEYQEFGKISRRVHKKKKKIYPLYVGIMEEFEKECDSRCLSPFGMCTRMYRLSLWSAPL
jgi:hypothetical protein